MAMQPTTIRARTRTMATNLQDADAEEAAGSEHGAGPAGGGDVRDEVIEEDAIPVLEEADDEPAVVADSDVIADEVVEAAPASDVFLADEAEVLVEAAPASEVVLADEALTPQAADSPPMLSQPPTGVKPADDAPMPMSALSESAAPVPAPTSDVDLMQMFDEPASATPAAPAPSAVAEPEVDLQNLFADEPEVHVEEAAPVSDVIAAEEVVEEVPGSAVVAAEEEAAPVSMSSPPRKLPRKRCPHPR